MNANKHTPGPWSVGAPTGLVNQISIQPCIGVVYGAGNEIKANAALIAAAPDLLEALRGTLDFVERHSNRWDGAKGRHPMSIVTVARAALAKAGAA